MSGLEKFAPTLIKRGSKPKGFGDDYLYLFGEKYIVGHSGKLTIQGYPVIIYKNHEELEKKLKPIFLSIITERVRNYEKVMKLPSYRVTVRKMSSRYGSNSKRSKHLTFATTLMHHSIPIIDSVVVHELAHIEVYDHSQKFYDVVYKYCPNYKEMHTKLKKGEFK